QLHAAVGGFQTDVVDARWSLVWKGVVTNDTFHALRAYTRPPARGKATRERAAFRSRRIAPASTQGRWSLVTAGAAMSQTARANAMAQQLLARYGVVIGEAGAAENLPGGFSAVYPVLKAMEEAGRIRRGYFIATLGATQFASAGALDLLRSFRDEPDEPETLLLAATDPANPYGTLLKWPSPGLMRVAGASVITVNGALGAYVGRGEKQLTVFLPDDEPSRGHGARAMAGRIVTSFETMFPLLARVDDQTPIAGRTIERVRAAGKNLLFDFSGGLHLRTHMRMNGSWHIYRAGERWQKRRSDMRIVIATAEYVAVGFNIPIAEFLDERALARNEDLRKIGPDFLSDDFDRAEAKRRIRARPPDEEIANVLLN